MLDLFFSSPELFFGVFSGALGSMAFLPYIIDTLRGRTHPDRASWLIWSVLGSIAVVSQIHEGATTSLWFAGPQVAGTVVITALAIWFGRGVFFSTKNNIIFALAALGLVSWYLTNTSTYALGLTIAISLLGGAVTAGKAYLAPHSETLTSWLIAMVASGFAMLSFERVDVVLMAYPAYLLVLYTTICLAILFGRSRVASRPHQGNLPV